MRFSLKSEWQQVSTDLRFLANLKSAFVRIVLIRPAISNAASFFCRTLLSILSDFNNAVIWKVSILTLITSTTTIFCNIVQRHQLQLISPSLSCSKDFNLFARSKDWSLLSLIFILTYRSIGTAKSTWWLLFFLSIKTKPDILVWIWWCVYISKS